MATRKKSSRRSTKPVLARPPAPPAKPASIPPVDPRLQRGVDLFNAHQFFQCHEVLESLWLETTGRSKDFYKGLIQAAVACHHWSKDNRAGALTLAQSSARYLKRYTPAYLGLDVEAFLRQFTELFGWLKRHPLRYDDRLVPVLRMIAKAGSDTYRYLTPL